MRKWLYAPPAIVLGLFLLIAGVSLAPKPVFAGCCIYGTNSTVSGDYCSGDPDCNPPIAPGKSGSCNQVVNTCTAPPAAAPTTAAPASTAATSTSGCNPSDYKAPGGLLADVTNTACTACGQCTIADIFIVGNTVTKLILGLSGSIMLLMMIYAGFLFLTSSGNSGQIDTAKKIIFGAVIGLVIVFAAYTAVQFILGALGVPNVPEIFSRPFLTAAKK